MADSEVDGAAAHLYGLRPDEFTAARDAAASEAGERSASRAIKALRRPSVAAWAVNALVRADPGRLEEVLALAAELREAQDDLDATALTALNRQRRDLVAALTRDAVSHAGEAGVSVSASARDDITRTLNAALRDAGAAAAVQTGRLVRALDASGLDPVDLSGAVGGRPPRGGARVAAAPRDDLAELRARRAAEKAVREAERGATDADRDLAAARAREEKARERSALLSERVSALEQELARVAAQADEAAAEAGRHARERDAAAARAREAATRAERARAALAAASDSQ